MSTTRHVDRLADRYLDPARRYLPRHEAKRRALCEANPKAARRWAQRLALHRAIAGVERATALEDKRQAALLAELATPSPPNRWPRPLLAVAAMAALATLVILGVDRLRAPAPDNEWFAARGGDQAALVGFGVAGLDEGGGEYDVVRVASAEAALTERDWVRFTYTKTREDLGWLFLFALKVGAEAERIWLAPTPEDGPTAASLPLATGKHLDLVEARLPAQGGDSLVIIGVFSSKPIALETMRAALEALPTTDLATLTAQAPDSLRVALRLGPSDLVQLEVIRVAPRGTP